MATTANPDRDPDRDPDDPLPSTTQEEFFTPSQQFYETLTVELETHARHWLRTPSSETEFESTHIRFTPEELVILSNKNRPDGKNESDILQLVQTKKENKTKTKELNRLKYIQSKLTYQIRIAQEFAVEYFDRSPTQLDIHTFKQQELESVKELIELELRRRSTYTETDTDTTTTTKNTIDLLNVDGESSTLDGTTSTMNTPSSPTMLDGPSSILDGTRSTNTSNTTNTTNTSNTANTANTANTTNTASTLGNSNKFKKTNVNHKTMELPLLTPSTVQFINYHRFMNPYRKHHNINESVQKTFNSESMHINSSNKSTKDQLEKNAINPSPSYNIIERWKNGKLIQIQLNKLICYCFGR